MEQSPSPLAHSLMATFKLIKVSSNKKTGPMPVSITSKDTCPSTCPFKGKGCYARLGHLNIHWARATTNGIELKEFCDAVKDLPNGQVWRHNEAGDLPGNGSEINQSELNQIVEANNGKKGYTYTHYLPSVGNNSIAIKSANDSGFTINLSADNLSKADEFVSLGIAPVVVVVPSDKTKSFKTDKGNSVTICPNVTSNGKIQCITCKLCAKANRKAIVGFPAHGIMKKTVSEIVGK